MLLCEVEAGVGVGGGRSRGGGKAADAEDIAAARAGGDARHGEQNKRCGSQTARRVERRAVAGAATWRGGSRKRESQTQTRPRTAGQRKSFWKETRAPVRMQEASERGYR